MRTIIAGSRDINRAEVVFRAIERACFYITEVVSGHSGGVDLSGEDWARRNGVPVKLFKADWGLYGRSAGPRRNLQMAKYADALIAVWDGESRGTQNMIKRAKEAGLRVYVHSVTRNPSKP
jgi:hypothetical protein